MHLGPGVFVGPAFIALGVAGVLFRERVAAWLGRSRSASAYASSDGVLAVGSTSIFAGTIGLLAGLGWLRWLPF